MSSEGSILFGSQDQPLLELTLGELIEQQSRRYGDQTAAVFPWQKTRMSYQNLNERSKLLAKSMLEMGLKHGDCIGIMAGNCYQYIEVFLGAARIGCPVVVLNNTYTPNEMVNAVNSTGCVLLFLASSIGMKDQATHIKTICDGSKQDRNSNRLQRLVVLSDNTTLPVSKEVEIMSYNVFVLNGHSVFVNNAMVRRAERKVSCKDVLNLQFTSGTTGVPKAAMLTHRNLINNGFLLGQRMNFGPGEIICCPPPLFHCFGLVMGFLGSFTTGSTIVFPSDQYNANDVVQALLHERCSTLYGVPTMFVATLEANKASKHKFPFLKKSLAAGAPVPMSLMQSLRHEMGIVSTINAYGMTETSPVTCMTSLDDSLERRVRTIGTVLPHTGIKIIDKSGNIVSRGERGEICTSGYALQKGYWKNDQKTQEVMKRDEHGMWMHTGDEGMIDEAGYCWITGRIKDMIIRGGENIYPKEIEERLLSHTALQDACVVGIPDDRYGEVVACFLKQHTQTDAVRPDNNDIADWVRQALGRHKAPKHIFWIGDEGVGSDFPKTGSGKHQKHILRALGQRLLKASNLQARL